MAKCEVCHEKEALYRCPKTSVRYCSLVCYKSITLPQPANEEADKSGVGSGGSKGNCNDAETPAVQSETVSDDSSPKALGTYQYALDDGRMRELLRHNTVKFHLDKVYKILNVNSGSGPSDSSMTLDMKRELAMDYLNTLRTGGIHCNEAIEEFCQIFLELLRDHN